MMEILAPGGSLEAIEVALHRGADAVYVGVGELNARVKADNPTPEELPRLAAYVHSFGARLYVTLNVPLRPETLAGAARVAAACHAHGADAVIVRDPLLMAALHAAAPDLPVHASTQFGASGPAGARRARALGCTRVILAREMSREAIAEVARAVPDLELEVFVFGAQCFGVSGHCLFGAALGGRSGNYGACNQPCRLPFTDADGRPAGHLFSMTDLDLLPRLPELAALGVRSLKIEGRMKPPAYVGCITHWLRTAVDGRDPPGLTTAEYAAFDRDISTIFSRARSSGFFDGETDRSALVRTDHPGHRGLDVGAFQVEGASVVFTTPVDLNIRDGLLLRYGGRGTAAERFVPMSIAELYDGRPGRGTTPRIRVSAGESVRVPVAATRGLAAVAIHSSDPVRQKWEAVGERLRGEGPPWPRFDTLALTDDGLYAEMSRGRIRTTARVPLESSPARGGGLTVEMAARLFGDSADYRLPPDRFVVPSALKAARRALVERFEAAAAAWIAELAGRLEAHIGAADAEFLPTDAELLEQGPALVSRVRGFAAGEVRDPAGRLVQVRPGPGGTRLDAVGRGGPGAAE